jgi:1,4-dihydroxy-2-naphthoate octaprenyltransferase
MDMDRAKGVYSLPVILGERWARYSVIVMLSLQYVLTLLLILRGDFHWAMALLFLNLPCLWRLTAVFKQGKPASAPADFPAGIWPLWFSAYAFDHTRKFSALFLLGLLADILLTRWA